MNENRPRLQFSLRTMFLVVLAFAAGFAARNIASGLHPLAMTLTLPSSTTPIAPGDSLIVESLSDETINRRVRVLADGTVTLPIVGTISIAGQTLPAVQQTLTTAYQKYYKTPALQVYRADASEPLK